MMMMMMMTTMTMMMMKDIWQSPLKGDTHKLCTILMRTEYISPINE